MRIILASASPRRKELLAQIGWEFEVCISNVEEKVTKTLPEEVVKELSRQKAKDVFDRVVTKDVSKNDLKENEPVLVIGADTIVACDGQILGKPKGKEDAVRMLHMLAGRSHQVYTGVTLILYDHVKAPMMNSFYEETTVTFYPMSEEEIISYVDTGEPSDKAGAYGIQGLCARYIQGIQGDYNNVVGLPVGRLYQELQKMIQAENEKKKVVIFDLDGTLSDSIESIKYCADQAVAPFGYGPFTVGQYKYFVGDGAANLIKRCLIAGDDEELVHFEEAYANYMRIFRDNCMYQVKAYEGIQELLTALKQKGLKIAVLSNKPHMETVRVIETLFGAGYFDVIQGQEAGIAIKPSPEGGFSILKKLDCQPKETLYLGDTATDMKTGKALGALTFGVLWGFRDQNELEEGRADVIIRYPLEVLDWIS